MDAESTKYRKWALEYLKYHPVEGCLDRVDEIVAWLRSVGFEDGTWVLDKLKDIRISNRMTEARSLLNYVRSGVHYTPVREE